MRRPTLTVLAVCLLPSAVFAQSVGEKTGVNSTLGISPTTADFVKEAATSDMTEIAAAKIALEKGNAAEKKFADFVNVGIIFLHPIVAGDAAIEITVFDVTADFLRANQTNFQFFVIDVRNVRTAADLNIKTGLAHLLDCGFLQTAFGQAAT